MVRPRALTCSATFHQWLTLGVSARRTLPTICVHMCSVSRVGCQAERGSAGQQVGESETAVLWVSVMGRASVMGCSKTNSIVVGCGAVYQRVDQPEGRYTASPARKRRVSGEIEPGSPAAGPRHMRLSRDGVMRGGTHSSCRDCNILYSAAKLIFLWCISCSRMYFSTDRRLDALTLNAP